ncbi:MAG: TonB-dependent receptor domain-containing protein, partial [Chitinophagaceae bacterium]
SHTRHNFHYKNFKQLTFDFSGNRLPGVPPHTISTGFDFLANNGLLGALTYYYNGKIALNDANSEFAEPFHLIGAKAGYEKWSKNKFRIKLVAGVENLLDEQYSLGNDINGFGGRYYNAAAGRNYYASIILNPVFNRDQ